MPKPELRLFDGERPESESAERRGATDRPGAEPCSPDRVGSPPPDPKRLRIRRERELDRIAGAEEAKTVSVSLGSILPLLLDAVENDRAWLRDFGDEPVRIDADLYDVLLAYHQLRRPAAA